MDEMEKEESLQEKNGPQYLRITPRTKIYHLFVLYWQIKFRTSALEPLHQLQAFIMNHSAVANDANATNISRLLEGP